MVKRSFNIGYDAKRIFHNKTGLGNYSRDLIKILSKYYPNNNYFLYNPKITKSKLFSYESHTKNIVEKNPLSWFHSKFYNYWRQRGIVTDLKKDKIDIYHGLTGEIPQGLKNKGIKTVVTVHDLIFMRFPQFYSFFDRNIHKIKARYAVKNADVVVAVSQQTKEDIIEFFGIEREKIQVVYQGCQEIFKHLFSTQEKNSVLQKFNLPKHYILNVGTIEARKNILAGVKAIQNIDTHLVIVGSETPYTKKVKEYITLNKLEPKISFLKGVTNEELAILYQSAQLFIYPSLFEGFGIPIIEALFSGIPVISSKGGCFSEAGGPSSIYINPNNVDELHEAIKTVLSDKVLRDNMIAQGYEYAQRFTSEYIGASFNTIYNELLSN